jgi:hypothetical protein
MIFFFGYEAMNSISWIGWLHVIVGGIAYSVAFSIFACIAWILLWS